MKLDKKKRLAASTLGVGLGRITFNVNRLDEIKEAITKQDIRDLFGNGAIMVKEIRGSRTAVKEKRRRRGQGSIRKKARNKKREYMIITRKLRAFIVELLKHESISKERYVQLRKEIRAHSFKSKSHLKERIKTLA